jgi:hypothetical protein
LVAAALGVDFPVLPRPLSLDLNQRIYVNKFDKYILKASNKGLAASRMLPIMGPICFKRLVLPLMSLVSKVLNDSFSRKASDILNKEGVKFLNG